ncbi:MAG: trypsin-like peptidase domain-containing protein, partial [Candidatus Subteraquimicrobiales bacterium]|nr:trypsin-like peptidase domain-containing protein [Candidatus Subteraquimicrobiales bacterium]
RVIGKDYETDIAVVKVDMRGLSAAKLGSVKDLEVGELVVAIGSPYGFEHSVTAGIVSALYRQLTVPSGAEYVTFTDLIQTDAAINPGNSGGALCNAKGEVVGINTLIYSETGGYQGIGFAIPIDTAKDVADQLIKEGKVSRPFIGVSGENVNKEVAREYGLSVERGALIIQVYPDTPAEKAGLKRRDVVIKFDDKTIESMDDLIAAIRTRKVGDEVTIVFLRDNKQLSVKVTLTEKPVFSR